MGKPVAYLPASERKPVPVRAWRPAGRAVARPTVNSPTVFAPPGWHSNSRRANCTAIVRLVRPFGSITVFMRAGWPPTPGGRRDGGARPAPRRGERARPAARRLGGAAQ
jgi:hypothetical protein